jgi:hypothetical protein
MQERTVTDDMGQQWLETVNSEKNPLTGKSYDKVTRRVRLIDEEYRGFVISNDLKRVDKKSTSGADIVEHVIMKQLTIRELERPRKYSPDGMSYLLNDVSGIFHSLESAKDRIDFVLAHPFWCPMSKKDIEWCRNHCSEYKEIYT